MARAAQILKRLEAGPSAAENLPLFAAPPEAVYDAWTDPAQFARWIGPVGVPCDLTEMQAVVGGHSELARAVWRWLRRRSVFAAARRAAESI